MTILFIDSFDHYAQEHIDDKGYSQSQTGNHTISSGNGRRGTNCMRSTGTNTGARLDRNYLASDTIVMGFAFRWSAFPDADRTIVDIRDTGGSSLLLLEATSAGEIRITSGGQSKITATNFFSPTNYNHYEVKYTKGSGADGFAEFKKDQIIQKTITNSTETAQATAVRMMEKGSLAQFFDMDDLYILNGLGGSPKDDYLGNVRVDAHFADADGADTDFAPNTGAANFTHVDDPFPGPDRDTTYNQAGTITNRDLHSMDAASLNTTVFAVQPVVYAKKTDAGTVTAELISEKPGGGGEKSSGTNNASDNYNFEHFILEQDPDDSTEWDDTKINATEFGYKINNIVT